MIVRIIFWIMLVAELRLMPTREQPRAARATIRMGDVGAGAAQTLAANRSRLGVGMSLQP